MANAAQEITIRPAANDAELDACAAIVASSEPWITLGIDEATARQRLARIDSEIYVAVRGETIVGMVIVVMQGALQGYIRTLAVARDHRCQGLGARLVCFAEERIFREHPNVFLTVSSFNEPAQRLYRRLGYQQVGEFPDLLVKGHSELLMRKTLGPVFHREPAL